MTTPPPPQAREQPLILTRRIGETIVIGDQIAVTILDVKGHQFRVGIEAPPDVKILREELRNRDEPPEAA